MPQPWKTPYRPSNQVTQSYNDGVVTIYSVADAARPGYQPEPKLTKKVSLRYEEQRLGIQRYYSGQQNQVDIERVIRTQRVGNVNNQNVAITEDGRQYRVDLVQSVMDVWPESVDITLAKIEQEFEVP